MLRLRLDSEGTATIVPSDAIEFSGEEVAVVLGLLSMSAKREGMDALGLCYTGIVWTKDMLHDIEKLGVNISEFSKKLFGLGILSELYSSTEFPECAEVPDSIVWPMTRETDDLRSHRPDGVLWSMRLTGASFIERQ